jgi:hypothetical protein
MISVKDSLVSGTFVAELPLPTAGVLAEAGREGFYPDCSDGQLLADHCRATYPRVALVLVGAGNLIRCRC